MASVFFSYSHKDEAFRDQLEAHLALLKHEGLIDGWHDRRIVAGDPVDGAIFEKLETSSIILLLVSSDFLSSPYCYSREMTRAMELQAAGQARIIPVILRHCDWHGAPFGKLMAAPRDGKPIAAWPDRDEALADVAKQVRRAVESIEPGGAARPEGRLPRVPSVSAASEREPAASLPRSSNLRLKKTFTEQDRDDFLRSTFEFVCRFFEGSVGAVGERNSGVTGALDRIDTRRIAAILYRNGERLAECSVRLEGLGGRSNGIAFSYDASASPGSYNEMLSVDANEQSLYLTAMGMQWGAGQRDKHLSQEGAAEFLWDMFIRNAQR